MIAVAQEGGEPGESSWGCALSDELLPSPAERTASAQDSLYRYAEVGPCFQGKEEA